MVKQFKKGRKSRSAARFGPRYGRKSRKLVADLEEKSRARYDCPQCGRDRIRRTDTSIWRCSKCGYAFAGGAYLPETSAGRSVARSLKKNLEIQ
ncbi:MAG: 50S ribosomal protein L37Ae [Methanosaeta sp. PtaB.Bin039]|nr:MAG: 50S ribosomal protein L37Ae [Methanosaeta sp. PtaB.Bin039]OPY44684.1 MAG: 50S ribosomal protein L37Ae [Methanosaeta sp. PtaU1.Bin028]HOT06756.1 50S ribosomal protein L37ae [Methanotrichaceae archaeon]HQF15953.1 50S ribosomal protein L37ae [Methanotrichaceae archaeon]HQI90699.1 50S ribosomal protein L37ae [Methanotrichaceae archaeon]